MKWKSKKAFICSILAMSVSTLIVTPVMSCSSQISNTYQFDGQSFNSQQEVEKYARENLKLSYQSSDVKENYWILNDNGKETKYNDPYYLKQDLAQNITPINASTSINLKDVIENNLDSSGAIPNTVVGQLIDNNNNDKLSTIYKGYKDSYHYSEIEAKKSYFNAHNAYYFNDIYFPNKESLTAYLNENYDAIFKQQGTLNQFKILKGPNGAISHPIDTNSSLAKYQVQEFVKRNAKKIFAIKQNDNSYKYSNNLTYQELSKNLSINDIEYTKIYNNEGKNNYVVDLHNDDNNNLYGPYFYNGSSDIENITDKSLWKEVDKSDRDILNDERENNLIQNFFSSLENDNVDFENNPSIFNIEKLKDVTETYNQFMKTNAPSVWNHAIKSLSTLLNGKRFNTFNKIPLMYSLMVDYMVNNEIDSYIIFETKKYFREVTKHFDKLIRTIIPEYFLTPLTSKANDSVGTDGLLSFESLFGLNNRDFNISVNINYYTDKIKQNYKHLLSAMNIATTANNNGMILSEMLEFNIEFFKNDLENYDDSKILEYQKLWELFSCSNIDTLKDYYNKYIDIEKISLDDFIDYSAVLITKNQSLSATAQEEFDQQLKKYLDNRWNFRDLDFFKEFKDISTIDRILTKVGNSLPMFLFFKDYFINNNIAANNLWVLNIFNKLPTVTPKAFQDVKLLKENVKKLNSFIFDLIIKSGPIGLITEYIKNVLYLNLKIFSFISSDTFTKICTNLMDSYKHFVEIVSCIDDVFEAIGEATKLLDFFKFVPYLNLAIACIEAVIFLVDFFVPKYEEKSYIFKTNDDVNYIWDGGLKEHLFGGILTNEKNNINNMKILEPVQITTGRAWDFYYYNGKKYSLTSSGEKEIVEQYAKDIINNKISPENINIYYSFLEENSNIGDLVNSLPTGISESLEGLSNDIYNHVFVSNNSDLFVTDNSYYKYTSGNWTIDLTGTSSIDIPKILDDKNGIKEIKIAMKPKLDKYNFPLGNNEAGIDQSISQYILPGDSYDMKTGNIIKEETKDKSNEYIIIDTNTNNNQANIDNPKQLLESQFVNSFNVESKIVYEKDTIGKNYFSDFSNQVNNFIIYKAKDPSGLTKYFLNQSDAFNWLLSLANYKVVTNNKIVQKYIYKSGLIFDSIEEFDKWVKESIKVNRS